MLTVDEILDPAVSPSTLAELAQAPGLDLETRAALGIAPAAPAELRRRVLHEALDRRREGGLYSKRERADFWRRLRALVSLERSSGEGSQAQRAAWVLADTMLERRMPREIEETLDIAYSERVGARIWAAGLLVLIGLGAVWGAALFVSSL